MVKASGQLWVASLGVNNRAHVSPPGTKITGKKCTLSKSAVPPHCSAQRSYWKAGLLFRECDRGQEWTQGSLKELSKGKFMPCTLNMGSFSKRVTSRLGMNYFPPPGICKATSHTQCPKHRLSLRERYWYTHGGGWSTQLTGGADGAGLAQPQDWKDKGQLAMVFNHLEGGPEKTEPDPSQRWAVQKWRKVRKSQQEKLELGIRWGRITHTKRHEKVKYRVSCPKRLRSLHQSKCSALGWMSPSASWFEASLALSSRLAYFTLPVVPSNLNHSMISWFKEFSSNCYLYSLLNNGCYLMFVS